jgi:acyl dehydratase
VTDQRHRLALAWTADPRPFHRDHPVLKILFNSWRLSGIVTAGSGRPVNAHVSGDANRDGNSENDRLPGVGRNSSTGPNYVSTDMRITRIFQLNDRVKLEATAESFNLLNHQNQRLDVNDNGFSTTAADFILLDRSIGAKKYPGYFTRKPSFLTPTNAYAPRQVQFALRLKF